MGVGAFSSNVAPSTRDLKRQREVADHAMQKKVRLVVAGGRSDCGCICVMQCLVKMARIGLNVALSPPYNHIRVYQKVGGARKIRGIRTF